MIRIALSLVLALPAFAEAQELIPYRAGASWGYASPGGKVKLRPLYDAARPFSEGLALVMKNGRYGFIDAKGREKIKPVYQSAGPFSDGLAPVKLRGRWGYIRRDGSEAHPFTLDEAGIYAGGRAPAKKSGATGLLNPDTEFIPCDYEEIQPFSEGLARVRRGGLYGFVDEECREAAPAVYDNAFPFSGGFASARLRGKYGFILRSALAFKEKDFIDIGPYSEGLAPAKERGGAGERCGYIDPEGGEKIPFSFFMCASFSEGLAPVLRELSGKWGFIDAGGKEAIKPLYDSVTGFSGGIANVSRDGVSFYIDKTGREYLKNSAAGRQKEEPARIPVNMGPRAHE